MKSIMNWLGKIGKNFEKNSQVLINIKGNHMLKIQLKSTENEIIIFNNTTEDYGQVTIRYFYHGEKWGELGFRVLPAQSLIRWEEERLSNKTIEVETLAVISQGILLQHFSGVDAEGNLGIISKVLIPKREIVELVFDNLYSLHSPQNSSILEKKEILNDFVNLLFAIIDTEYREYGQKWDYGYYLINILGVQLEQSEETDILLAKCITLMEFLNLNKDEMAIYFLEFTA